MLLTQNEFLTDNLMTEVSLECVYNLLCWIYKDIT